MSLIIALETYKGIVITADRLSTLIINNDKLGTVDCFPKTFNAHKLFVTADGYGLAYCGDNKLKNDILVEQFVSEEICGTNFGDMLPIDIAHEIMCMFKPFKTNTTLLLCGYHHGKSFIIEIDTSLDSPFLYS